MRSRYRFIGKQLINAPEWAYRNNGFKLHSQHPTTMNLNQKSPIGVEAQLLGGNGIDDRPTLNLCTGGTDVSNRSGMPLGSAVYVKVRSL